MLSRTADSLYWLSRYIERAEFTARILETTQHLASVPEIYGGTNEWESALIVCSALGGFQEIYGDEKPSESTTISFLAYEPKNPSSIVNCLNFARQSARAHRTAISVEMWETINTAWIELQNIKFHKMTGQDFARFLEWVKDVSLKMDGCAYRTLLRVDNFYFERIGTYIERADNTARLLDVKYHVLLPDYEQVGGGLDYYQWTSLLRSVSALTAYHWVYRDGIKPWLIADLLILKDEMPRSLASCYFNIVRYLDALGQRYGRQGKSQRHARASLARLERINIETIFQNGLHEFVGNFITDNNALGLAISEQYLS